MCLRGRGGGGIFVIWDPNPKSLHPVPKECGGGEGGMGGLDVCYPRFEPVSCLVGALSPVNQHVFTFFVVVMYRGKRTNRH